VHELKRFVEAKFEVLTICQKTLNLKINSHPILLSITFMLSFEIPVGINYEQLKPKQTLLVFIFKLRNLVTFMYYVLQLLCGIKARVGGGCPETLLRKPYIRKVYL